MTQRVIFGEVPNHNLQIPNRFQFPISNFQFPKEDETSVIPAKAGIQRYPKLLFKFLAKIPRSWYLC